MQQPSKMRPFICLLAVFVVGSAACDRMGEDPSAGDAARATEECPGATAEEAALDYHPRILRGEVSAPPGAMSSRGWLDGWFVETAHAAPLEEEQSVRGATVELYRVDADGDRTGEPLREATTDGSGEYCMKLPEGVDPSSTLMAEARFDDARMRRVVVSQFATDIYSTSEALLRLLRDHNVDFTELPTETYFNLESMAATAVDLLDPIELDPADGVDEAVAQILKVLEEDERIEETLQVWRE